MPNGWGAEILCFVCQPCPGGLSLLRCLKWCWMATFRELNLTSCVSLLESVVSTKIQGIGGNFTGWNSRYRRKFQRAVVSQIQPTSPKLAAPFENSHDACLNTHQYWIQGGAATSAADSTAWAYAKPGHEVLRWPQQGTTSEQPLYWVALNGFVYLTAGDSVVWEHRNGCFPVQEGKKKEKWPKTWYLGFSVHLKKN